MVTLVNRAKMTTATTGTGTITLGTAEAGYQSFADAGVVDTNVVRYVIEDGTAWEIGTGTYSAGTLTRVVSESSNADAALNLTGSAVVYVSATAEDIPPVLELYAENYDGIATKPAATGTNAVSIGRNSTASGDRSIALGPNSTASALFSTAFGYINSATATGATAGGYNSSAGGAYSLAIYGSSASQYSTAIGNNSGNARATTATGSGAMALGGSYASGADSFAAAIANNTSSYGATGANSVAMGDRNKASGGYSVSLGRLNQSTASNSTSLGIYSVASSKYSLAVGNEASTRATPSISFSTGSFSGIAGQHQISMFVLRQRTTDETSALLLADGGTSGSIDDQIILPNNAAFAFHGIIVARQQASQGTASAAWKIEGLIRREGSAGTTVLVNSATTVLDHTPAWGMALSADTTNGGLKIEVTGATATNIAWNGNIHTSEVTY